MFPLCRTCAETQIKLPLYERSPFCRHDREERVLTGTWSTPELMEAKRQGYTILKLYEEWHFPYTSTQLFKQYVNTFLKLNQEANGWPMEVGEDPEKRSEYVANYLRHEGVELYANNIAKNPGKRSTAKMMLNSFWGKFGQQPNKTQVNLCTNPAKFHSIRIVNDHMLEVVHSYEDNTITTQTNINIFVACFTTCWARLKLY